MRALWMLVLVALLSTACSSSSQPVEAAPTATTLASARSVGEPSSEIGAGGDEPAGDVDALAFEDPQQEATVEDEPSSQEAAEVDAQDAAEVGSGPAPTELALLLDDLIAFVEAQRGHRFSITPEVVLLEGDAFKAAWDQAVADSAAESASEYADYTDIYRAMGILDDQQTLEETWKRFGDAGVLGYYESERQRIVLRSGDITAYTKTVLVHELVHALEDQVFGIDREEYDGRDDEIAWTFSALIEGSAGFIEERYRDTLSTAERDEEIAVQNSLPRTVSLSEFTTSFLELQFGRYRYGDAFAEALWDEGQSAVDEALEDPPTTSEVVIDPSAYLAGDTADGEVELPIADGTVFRSGVWGEAGWAAVFSDEFGRVEALSLADGWGGDSFVAWRTTNGVCVRAHIEGDSAGALDNYAYALEEWSRSAEGREVFYPAADLVRVTSCV